MHTANLRRNLAVLGILLVLAAVTRAAPPQTKQEDSDGEASRRFPVSQTFNNRPFSYRMRQLSDHEGYDVYRLTYPSPVVTPVEQNNTIPADYYLPKGVKPGDPKRPAVVCLHILAGNYELVHLTCSLLASRGVPAVMFKLPYYGERGLPEGHRGLLKAPHLFLGAMPQAIQDVRRTVDLLASRPEINPERIGITGISLGGILAATVAGAEPRVWRAVLILAGGDLPTIIHHARETRELSKLIRALPEDARARLRRQMDQVEPLRQAPNLRNRARQGRVLMVNASQDEVVPKACTEKLASALGLTDKVVWLDGLGHYTAMAALPDVMQTMARFFAQDLAPELRTEPAAAPAQSARQMVVGLVRQIAAILGTEPGEGRCHFVDLAVSVTAGQGKKPVKAHVRYIRGPKWRFRLEAGLPMVGNVAMGQYTHPWMASGEKTVFQGVLDQERKEQPGNPLAMADPEHLLKLRMVQGLIGGIMLTPAILDQWITASDDTTDDKPAIRIAVKDKKNRGSLRLVFKPDRKTPETLTFSFDEASGIVGFRAWQVNTIAHDSLFEEPAGLKRKEVKQVNLVRIFSAMFNFAMEKLE